MTSRPASTSLPRRRRLWLRIVIATVFLLPLLVFLLSNAWLHTSWGKNWLAQKITQRTGLPVQIGGAGWLPGGQVWIDDLRVLAPAPATTPLLQIRCVSIRPAWGAWLRGSRKISDIHLIAPRLHASTDTLQQLLPAPTAPPPPVTPTPPPAVASSAPPPTTVESPAPPTPPAAPPPPPAPSGPPSPTVWLHITDGHLALTHPQQAAPLLAIENISATLPIAGAPAAGHLRSDAIRALGQLLAPMGHIDVRWQYPLWENTSTRLTLGPLHADAKFQFARIAGLPFSVIIAQQPQHLLDSAAPLQAQNFQSLHRLAGYLIAPQTWQGESLCQAEQLRASFAHHKLHFFAAQSRLILQGGMIQCTDLRLLGDDFAVLANGMLNSRGESLGIVRLTAPRAAALGWEKRWLQSFPQQPLTMPPLWNEDRRAIDILCGGTWAQPWLSFDQGNTLLSLQSIARQWQQNAPTSPLAPTP